MLFAILVQTKAELPYKTTHFVIYKLDGGIIDLPYLLGPKYKT